MTFAACNSNSDEPGGGQTTEEDVTLTFCTQAQNTMRGIAMAVTGEWKAPTEPVAASTTLKNDDNITITTIAAAYGNCNNNIIHGLRFPGYIYVRSGEVPSVGTPQGTGYEQSNDKEKSTPVQVVAKKDLTLTIYYRRQLDKDGDKAIVPTTYTSNWKEDLLMCDQSAPTTVMDGLFYYDHPHNASESYCVKTYRLTSGHTYTLYCSHATIRIYGLTYDVLTGAQTMIPQYTQVGVFGYYTGSSNYDNATATADFMYNQLMTVEENISGTSALTYSPWRLWPNDGGKLSFWAYYPYSATIHVANSAGDKGIGISTTAIKDGTGMGSIYFEVQPTAAEQVDLMVSELVANRTKPALTAGQPAPVLFTFHHALAQVRLYIKLNFTDAAWTYVDKNADSTPDQDADGYNLLAGATTTVSFENIYTEGTLTLSPSTGTTSTATWANAWTPTAGTLGQVSIENYDHTNIHFNANRELSTTASTVAPADRLLMIPQSITNAQAARIVTTVTQGSKTARMTINLQDMNITWRPGYIYSYAFTVALTPGQDVVAGPSVITATVDQDKDAEQW